VTVTEAAARAGVSATIIKRWLDRGDLRGEEHGKSWTIDAESLELHLGKPRLNGRPRKLTSGGESAAGIRQQDLPAPDSAGSPA